MNLRIFTFARRWFAFAFILLPFSSWAQSGGVLSADKSTLVTGSPTEVKFTLVLPANPNLLPTSPNLLRLVNGKWTIVSRLYDDGTHGDTIAGDNTFSFSTTFNPTTLDPLNFKASTAYKGSLLRVFSNPLQLNITSPLSLQVNSGSDEIFISQGSEQNVVSTITLANAGFGNVNVQNVTTITPLSGISMTSDYPPGGWNSSISQSFVLNQSFTGLQPGDYLVVNTATIVGHGIVSSDSFVVHVIPVGGDPIIFPLGSDPDAIQVGVPTTIRFTASIANFISPAPQLQIRLVDGATDPVIGQLFDNGQNGDLLANDQVYSGLIPITANSEGKIYLRATGTFPGVAGERSSAPYVLNAVCYPTELSPSDLTKTVYDPLLNESFICNEVLVFFADATTCNQVLEAANAVNGTIIGSQVGLGFVQIAIPNPQCTAAPVYNAIAVLQQRPEVLAAEPNFVGVVPTEFIPNEWSSGPVTQYAPQKMRADEAWVIARGAGIIAVIDTGVNYNHEDLTGNVINGKDFIAGDNDSLDEGDHGTHVAGIAAALSNNGKGIAGISWNSKILAIRGLGGTYAALASAIKYAADNGAKVINISGGGTVDSLPVKTAVTYAVTKGCLVISTPGNLSNVASGGDFFPGAYPNVFTVGSTTSSDTLAGTSNPASYVDIVAPGANIYSTLQSGGYGFKSGVSMAAPNVAGAAAVLWSHFPTWTAAQVRQRLEKTAVPISGSGTGAGRVDLFEAVFNGSFEDDIKGWQVIGTAGAVPNLGPLTPTDRKNFGFASSGPDAAEVQTTLRQSFTIQPGVTTFDIAFDYNFVSEEYPEWVNRGYNDNLRISLVKPDGTSTQLAFEDIDHSPFSIVGGIDFPGGDNTVGQTGWKAVSTSIPVTQGPGSYTIVIRDEGDGIYDSNVLIDHIRFKK